MKKNKQKISFEAELQQNLRQRVQYSQLALQIQRDEIKNGTWLKSQGNMDKYIYRKQFYKEVMREVLPDGSIKKTFKYIEEPSEKTLDVYELMMKSLEETNEQIQKEETLQTESRHTPRDI